MEGLGFREVEAAAEPVAVGSRGLRQVLGPNSRTLSRTYAPVSLMGDAALFARDPRHPSGRGGSTPYPEPQTVIVFKPEV